MIICVECGVSMRCGKNGDIVRMGPGGEKLSGDKYYCPTCSNQIVTGFGKPIMPWDDNYESIPVDLEAIYD